MIITKEPTATPPTWRQLIDWYLPLPTDAVKPGEALDDRSYVARLFEYLPSQVQNAVQDLVEERGIGPDDEKPHVSPEDEEAARYAGSMKLLAFDEEAKAVKQFVRERAGACAGCPGFSPVQLYDRCAAVIAGFRSHLEQMCRAGTPGSPEYGKLLGEWDDIKHSLALAGKEAERRRRRDRSSNGPQEWDAADFDGYLHSDYNSAPTDTVTPEGGIDELITVAITEDPRQWLAEFAAALDHIADGLNVFSEDYWHALGVVIDDHDLAGTLRYEWTGVMADATVLAERTREVKDHLLAVPELCDVRPVVVAAVGLLDLMARRWKRFTPYCDSEIQETGIEAQVWYQDRPDDEEPPPPFALKKAHELAESIRNDRAESKLREYASILRVYCEFSATATPRREGPRKPPGEKVLEIDEKGMEAIYNGQVYPLTPDQTVFLKALAEQPGAWISGPSMKKYPDQRLDKLKKRLPEPIRSLIKSDRGKGYRLRLP